MRIAALSLSLLLVAGCASSSAPPPSTQGAAAEPPAAGPPAAAAKTPGSMNEAAKVEGDEPFARVTIDQLATKLQRKDKLTLFDANTKERYEQGHIPGAKWINSMSVTAADLPGDKAEPLVFYCGNEKCKASHNAAKAAVGLGHSNVSVLPAGILGWEKAGRPTEK